VEIRTTDTSKLYSVKALLDSGATRSFIDRDFVCLKGINTQTLSRNIPVFNVDGVTPYKRLGKISDNLHPNNQNNQLERRAWPPRDVPLDAWLWT